MGPDAIVTILTGAGVAGIWVLCLLLGLMYPRGVVDDYKEEIRELKAELVTQRTRADAAVEAAQTANLLLAGIRREIGK